MVPELLPDAKHQEAFGQAMKSRVESTRGVVDHYDFSRARVVVDVGGGFGHRARSRSGTPRARTPRS